MFVTVSHSPHVQLVDECCYSFGSTDNARKYAREYLLEQTNRATSVHGILLNGVPIAVLGASGGSTGVHGHSALVHDGFVYLAVGDHLACLELANTELVWARKVDVATCFGVHRSEGNNALICHGELAVSRIAADGSAVWARSGADIFTGGLTLGIEAIHVEDFNGRTYRFSYADGNEV